MLPLFSETRLNDVFRIFTAGAAAAQDCFVLLNGLARTKISLTPMQLVLEDHSYSVVNRGYGTVRLNRVEVGRVVS